MPVTLSSGYQFGSTELVTNTKLHKLVDDATISGIGATLLSTTTVALNANADTVLYTVPVGKRCILSHAVLVAGADAASTDISIGQDGAETDFIPTSQCDNLDAANDAIILTPVPHLTPAKVKSYAAGTVIELKVTNQAGGATNTLFLYGTLY